MSQPRRWPVARDRLARIWMRLGRRRLRVVWHESYRLPLPALNASMHIDPRRADRALWSMQQLGLGHHLELLRPEPVTWTDIARVHTEAHIDRLTDPRTLSGMYGLDETDFPVDPVLDMVRRATGGTVDGARRSLRYGGPTLNLLGGFHHAGPDRGWGMCPINDIAIALAVARAEGFGGRALVLDLDAHPPDGTAACFAGDRTVDIWSISGSDWGALGGTTEKLLPPGAGDDVYLAALDELLHDRQPPKLTFVIAGGDVRQGDPVGRLGLSEDGAAQRDHRVAEWLDGAPSVWLPGGGYRDDAWRVLARTALALLHHDLQPPPAASDPLPAQFALVADSLTPAELGFSAELDDEDVDRMFGVARPPRRLFGAYTLAGLDLALERYGLLPALRRMGYDPLRIEIDQVSQGQRLRLWGRFDGTSHLLVESVLNLESHEGTRWLFVHWLTLRHPKGPKPRGLLPGQDVPGLGLAPEAALLLTRMARRLGAHGLMFRPAHLHIARQARSHFRFLDPVVQGRFEALLRDLGDRDLTALTIAADAGTLRNNGEPFRWAPEEMVEAALAPETPQTIAVREASHFTMPV